MGLAWVVGCSTDNPYSGSERPPLSIAMPEHWQKDQDNMDFWRTAFGHD
jgi:hypothetical protein